MILEGFVIKMTKITFGTFSGFGQLLIYKPSSFGFSVSSFSGI
jgi:hypothetical protein